MLPTPAALEETSAIHAAVSTGPDDGPVVKSVAEKGYI